MSAALPLLSHVDSRSSVSGWATASASAAAVVAAVSASAAAPAPAASIVAALNCSSRTPCRPGSVSRRPCRSFSRCLVVRRAPCSSRAADPVSRSSSRSPLLCVPSARSVQPCLRQRPLRWRCVLVRRHLLRCSLSRSCRLPRAQLPQRFPLRFVTSVGRDREGVGWLSLPLDTAVALGPACALSSCAQAGHKRADPPASQSSHPPLPRFDRGWGPGPGTGGRVEAGEEG